MNNITNASQLWQYGHVYPSNTLTQPSFATPLRIQIPFNFQSSYLQNYGGNMQIQNNFGNIIQNQNIPNLQNAGLNNNLSNCFQYPNQNPLADLYSRLEKTQNLSTGLVKTGKPVSKAPDFDIKIILNLMKTFDLMNNKERRYSKMCEVSINGSRKAEALAILHKSRPCFRKIDTLCSRLTFDVTRNDNVISNINSQGLEWSIKDFIFVLTRMISAWIVGRGYFHKTPSELDRIKNFYDEDLEGLFSLWEIVTIHLIEKIVATFEKIQEHINDQKKMYQKANDNNGNVDGNSNNQNLCDDTNNSNSSSGSNGEVSTKSNSSNSNILPTQTMDKCFDNFDYVKQNNLFNLPSTKQEEYNHKIDNNPNSSYFISKLIENFDLTKDLESHSPPGAVHNYYKCGRYFNPPANTDSSKFPTNYNLSNPDAASLISTPLNAANNNINDNSFFSGLCLSEMAPLISNEAFGVSSNNSTRSTSSTPHIQSNENSAPLLSQHSKFSLPTTSPLTPSSAIGISLNTNLASQHLNGTKNKILILNDKAGRILESSNDYQVSLSNKFYVDYILTMKVEMFVNRIMNIRDSIFFYNERHIRDHFPKFFFSKYNSRYMCLESIIQKIQEDKYDTIYELVHDLKSIVYFGKKYLKTNSDDFLEMCITHYNAELNEILKDEIFKNFTFHHIDGNPLQANSLKINQYNY